MELNTESKKHIEHVASDALGQLDMISRAAKDKFRHDLGHGSEAFANINTMTSGSAIQKLDRISRSNQASYQALADEPAIARVVVTNEAGKECTYYICRATPVAGIPNLASYRAPVGRLASLPIGDEFTLPNGTVVEVLERAQLRPALLHDGWDSCDTLIETEYLGQLTVKSLRALLAGATGEDPSEDILGQLLAEDDAAANLTDGVRRSVITKMTLRDQPILDQYQDEIFRLPLDKRLLLLGPPGTGKTTTLIRRLGQKIDTAFLAEDERRLIETVAPDQGVSHENSWLMFTPTELLKHYLKEAFAREGVPASDRHIQTWQQYRHELARNVFGVLRTATGGGTFVLKDALESLTNKATNSPIQWFEDFNAWQRNTYTKELREAAALLCDASSSDIQVLGERLQGILAQAEGGSLASIFGLLAAELHKVQALVTRMKEASDAKIKAALNLQLNRDKGFLDELANFIPSLQQAQASDSDELDDDDADEEEDGSTQRVGRAAALNAYMKAARTQARAAASKRAISKSSRNGKIIEWLEGRGLSEVDCIEVGGSLLVQTNARRFANPVKRYLDGVPKRYRAFRRALQQSGSWYNREGFEVREIHPLELDVVLLTMLRAASDLISRPNILRDIDSPAWSSLKPILSRCRTQVLVDEATDFSPIQLACMASLTGPRLRSFFACGDFNQRLTTWGARSSDDLKWIFPDFDIREVTVSYRQSRQLNELARAMISAVGGTEQDISLPKHVESDGVAPVLLEHAADGGGAVVDWLADRICEIERFVGQLPSIAIFVNGEDDVTPLAQALNTALGEHNIQVTACHEGQAVGQDSNVRVFDIQHIKGLEFEAVFFVGIDQLAAKHPALFDKYLYVGTTRAATYLGVTCEGSLPAKLEVLRAQFVRDWQ